MQYSEYVKQIKLSLGADIRVRGVGTNGTMALMLGAPFIRSDLATLTISAGQAGTLGSGTSVAGRVIFSNAADAPARGVVGSTTVNMVAPWIIGNWANSFLDYDVANGFVPVTYTQTNNSTTFSPGVANDGTAIVDSTLNVATTTTQTNTGTSNIYALRFGNISTTAAAVTLTGGTINIFSGGLLSRISTAAQTGTIASNIFFGDGTNRVDANVYVSIHNTIDTAPALNTTILSGVLTAANFIKAGPGLLNITNPSNSFSGKIQVNNGSLRVTTAGAAGGVTEFLLGGANSALGGSTSATNTPFVTLDFRSETSANYGTITLLEGVPVASINIGNVSAGASQTLTFAGLNFNTGNVAGGQLLNFAASSTSYFASISGVTNLGSSGTVFLNNAANMTLAGGLSGGAKLVKMGAGNLNLTTLNDAFDGGLEIHAGTVLATQARSLGFGSVILSGGVLTIQNAANTNFLEFSNMLVNGTATINIDRTAAAATPGPTVATPYSHYIGSSFNTLTLSDAVLTLTATQSYNQLVINSPTVVAKPSVLSPSTYYTFLRFDQPVSGNVMLTKTGLGRVNMNAVNTFTGTLRVTDGAVFATSADSRFTGVGGKVEVAPGGVVILAGKDNLANSNGIASFASNSIAMSGIGLRYALGAGDLLNVLPNDVSLPGRGGMILLDISYNQPINLSTIFGGDWWLGMSVANLGMTGAITPGNGNTYRLGGGAGNLTISTGLLNAAGAKVFWGKPNTYNGTTAPVVSGNQTYDGGTVIARGSITYLRSGNANGPLGTGVVDVFGTAEWDGTAGSAVTGTNGVTGGNRNIFVFHPGSILRFDNNQSGNMTTAGVTGDRWADTAGVFLNGSNITLLGSTVAHTTETVGGLSYDRGASITVTRGAATFNTTLTAAYLTRAVDGFGTVGVTYTAGVLAGTSGYERIMLSTAPAVANGMLHPSIVGLTDSQYLTYDATLGLRLVDTTATATYQTSVASIPAVSGGDKIFNIGVAGTLNGAIDVYALRSGFNISNGTASQITIRSGGMLNYANLTIQPNVYFGNLSTTTPTEALVYAIGTTTVTGQWQAASVTKFGTGTLLMNADQTQFIGTWNVNTGTLTTGTLAGFGTTPNPVTLHGGSTPPVVNFTYDSGSITPYAFTVGKITAWDNNNIQFNPAVVDRFASIGDVDLKSTASVPGGETTGNRIGFLFPFGRTTLTTGVVTLFDDYLINVEASGSLYPTGASSGVIFGGLINTGAVGFNAGFTKSGDGTLTLPDISGTFNSASIYVAQGTLRVTANGSLGGASTVTYVEYGGALDIAVPNFQPLGQLYFMRGATERWSVDGARPSTGTILVDAGVTLQLNTNLVAARTINLNGGTVTGFLRADDDATAVFRTAGPDVTWNLLNNSYVGIMNPLLPTNAGPISDPGKYQAPGAPFGTTVQGAILEIKGAITKSLSSSLTKIGPDMVILSGTNTYTGGTFVQEGVLQIGSSSAIPAAGPLGTSGTGVLDLNGYSATTAHLQGTDGQIINSLPVMKTLTLAGPSGGTYGGQLAGRINLVKSGTGEQILSGTNVHQGTTTVSGGRLTVSGTITESPVSVNGGTFALTSGGSVGTQSAGSVTVNSGGTFASTGTVHGSVVVNSGGSITTGDNVGQFNVTGTANSVWEGGSTVFFDFNNAQGFAPGTDWDFYQFNLGTLRLNATASSPISLYIDSLTFDTQDHGANNFNPNATYSWLFASAGTIDLGASTDDISSRFVVFDSTDGAGVFGTNNPYASVGGRFWVTRLDNALYVNYDAAAVPEPSSLLLTALAAAGWAYRRRRKLKEDARQAEVSTVAAVTE
ncbi:MAG: autotransporter-associated beta strand repeat-containing protein [Pirellulales bacterium]